MEPAELALARASTSTTTTTSILAVSTHPWGTAAQKFVLGAATVVRAACWLTCDVLIVRDVGGGVCGGW